MNPDRLKQGGLDDPVARSTRREQNRDAAPSPAEVEEKRREALSEQGCLVCGEDDPDALQSLHPFTPRCPRTPPPLMGASHDTDVFCTEHIRSSETLHRARHVWRALRSGKAGVVIFECGRIAPIEMPDSWTFPAKGEEHLMPPVERRPPDAPVWCECGDDIAETVRFDRPNIHGGEN